MTEHCSSKVTLPLLSVIGEDSSETFFNTQYNEAYHSKIGPILEAEHKFVKPSCLKELLTNKKKIEILDLFFGLGYNTGIALDYTHKISNSPDINFIAIEKDIEIINKIKYLQVPDWYIKWQNLLSNLSRGLSWQTPTTIYFENNSITLHLDNVFNLIDKLPKRQFDIIFFDPFSHKTTPEFWEESFLSKVFNLLADNGTLTTYSGLKRVEKLATDLGFKTKRVQAIGRKKHSLCIERG